MGIPMGISITSFQNKLATKGVRYDKSSKSMSAGTRIFKGTFAGHDAEFYVYYDPTSKNVYRAKAVIERSEYSMIDQVFDEFHSMLEEKYYEDVVSPKTVDDDGYPVSIVFTKLGRIDLFVKKMDADYLFHTRDYFILFIDYHDSKAKNENKANRLEDL